MTEPLGEKSLDAESPFGGIHPEESFDQKYMHWDFYSFIYFVRKKPNTEIGFVCLFVFATTASVTCPI